MKLVRKLNLNGSRCMKGPPQLLAFETLYDSITAMGDQPVGNLG